MPWFEVSPQGCLGSRSVPRAAWVRGVLVLAEVLLAFVALVALAVLVALADFVAKLITTFLVVFIIIKQKFKEMLLTDPV